MSNTTLTFSKTVENDIKRFIEQSNEGTIGESPNVTKNVEFEVRFGSFRKRDDRFFPGVNINIFDKLFSIINNWAQGQVFEKSVSVDVSFGRSLKRTDVLDDSLQIVNQIWKRKTKEAGNIDIKDFDIRIGLAGEEFVEPQKTGNPTFYRKKQRTSYVIGIFRYDLTVVNEGKTLDELNRPLGPLDFKYEVEIEYIGNNFAKKDRPDPKKVVYPELRSVLEAVIKSLQDNFFILSNSERDKVVEDYKALTGLSRFSPIGSQPFTLLEETLPIVETGYSVTDKTDGDRAFLFINSKGNVFIIKSSLEILATGLKNEKHKNTLYDGEYLKSTKVLEQPPINIYLVFDIIIHKTKDLRDNNKYNLNDRRKLFESTIGEFVHLDVTQPGNFTQVRPKNFLTTGNIFENAGAIIDFFSNQENNPPYNTDGLIFTPVNEPYFSKTPKEPSQRTYKWKPAELNTIDFYAEAVGMTQDGLFNIWHLYMATTLDKAGKFISVKTAIPPTGLREVFRKPVRLFQPKDRLNAFETFVPVGFLSEDNEPFYPGTVIEFRYNLGENIFVPMRTRWDKTFSRKGPNFEATAIDVWETISNPIPIQVITGIKKPKTVQPVQNRTDIKSVVERRTSIVLGLRKFHNNVKRQMFESLGKDSKAILDLAAGKGGDLLKYPKGAKVIGFDIDSESVKEANRRAKDLLSSGKISGKFNFFVMDLTKENVFDFLKAKPGIRTVDFDLVNSQFALHFFFEKEDYLRNYLRNVSQNLKEGGIFMGTAFDGEKVFNLLKDVKKGESKEGDKNGELVYRITKEYSDKVKKFNKLPMYGQRISAFLGGDTVMSQAFLAGETATERATDEYLINFEKLAEFAKEYDLEFLGKIDFSEYYQDKSLRNSRNPMSEAEKQYSFLNVSFTFRKTSGSLLQKEKEESQTIKASELIRELSEPTRERKQEPTRERKQEPTRERKEKPEQEPETESDSEEDEWDDLSKEWQKILGSKNFVKRECGGGGDCQFLSIAFALNSLGEGFNLSNRKLRKLVAKEIKDMSDDKFEFIMTVYRLEQEEDRFEGDWDPNDIETKDDLIAEIKKPGFNFQGDDVTISLISKALKLDFVILNNKSKTIYKTEGDIKHEDIVILFFTGDGGHYQLVGLEDQPTGEIDMFFNRDDLPNEIRKIMSNAIESPRKPEKKKKKKRRIIVVEPEPKKKTEPKETKSLSKKVKKLLKRKPCGTETPRLSRAELTEIAKELDIKGVSKKNMKTLCEEINELI